MKIFNILFSCYNRPSVEGRGGVEIATRRTAIYLKNQGHKIFETYEQGRSGTDMLFAGSLKLVNKEYVKKLKEFIEVHDIDIIVNTGHFYRHEQIIEAVKSSPKKPKIVFVNHFGYGDELIKYRFRWLLHAFKNGKQVSKNLGRIFTYPVYKVHKRHSWLSKFRYVAENSDALVFLSEKNLNKASVRWSDILKEKTYIIPNIIPPVFPEVDLNDKQPRVLVLSRLDEIQKRISKVLEIWKYVENKPALSRWQLDIVGDGDDRKMYEGLTRKLKLERVTFHGWCSPQPFLRQASVLLVTSAYEGFCMSIAEAMNAKCVPVISSGSAGGDVVREGVDGMIVSENLNAETFAENLATLMNDDSLRCGMATEAYKQCERFSHESVGRLWDNMLMKITSVSQSSL